LQKQPYLCHMARVKIDLPEKFLFKTEIPVRITDLNYGGHVGNDTILSILHESRMQLFASLGYKTEVNIEGVGVIMTDVAMAYKSETFYGEIMVVELTANDFNKYGFDVVYRVYSKQSGKDIAHAKTGIVCFDYEKRKIAALPEAFKNKLTN